LNLVTRSNGGKGKKVCSTEHKPETLKDPGQK